MKSPYAPIANQRGEIVTNIVAALIVAIGITGSMYLFKTYQSGRSNTQQMEAGGDVVGKKLEELLSLPWSAAELTAGSHADAGTATTWEVTDISARLKKIEVVAKHAQKVTRQVSSRGILASGYRYYDF